MDGLITIGELAARTRLSRKALRLYGERGLLTPARVEEAGRVRWYGTEQVERARLIALMRSVGMPLARIGQVLELDGGAAARSVADYWREAEAEHAARRSLVSHLEHVLEGTAGLRHPIAERDVPEKRVVTVRGRVDAAGLPGFLEAATAELFARLTEAGARVSGPLFAVYHGIVSQDSDGPVELCVPTEDPVEATDRITVRVEPAHREAYLEVTKRDCPFPLMAALHDSAAAWLERHGLRSAGAAREIYYPNFTTAADGDHVMDIAYPFRRPGAPTS